MSVHMQSDLVSTGLTVVAASTALVSIGYASICIAEIFVLHGKQMSCNDFFYVQFQEMDSIGSTKWCKIISLYCKQLWTLNKNKQLDKGTLVDRFVKAERLMSHNGQPIRMILELLTMHSSFFYKFGMVLMHI